MDLTQGGLADSPRPGSKPKPPNSSFSGVPPVRSKSVERTLTKPHRSKRSNESSESLAGEVASTTTKQKKLVKLDEPALRSNPSALDLSVRSQTTTTNEEEGAMPPPPRSNHHHRHHSKFRPRAVASTLETTFEQDDDGFTSWHSPAPIRTSPFFVTHNDHCRDAASPGPLDGANAAGQEEQSKEDDPTFEYNDNGAGYVSARAWDQEIEGSVSFDQEEDSFVEARDDVYNRSDCFTSEQLAENDDNTPGEQIASYSHNNANNQSESGIELHQSSSFDPTLDSPQGRDLCAVAKTPATQVASASEPKIDRLNPIPSLYPGPNPFLEHSKALASSERLLEDTEESRDGSDVVKAEDVFERVKTETVEFGARFGAICSQAQALFERSLARQVALLTELDKHSDALGKEDDEIAMTKQRLDEWTGQLFKGRRDEPET